MSLCQRDVMVRREQYQDLLWQAERERLTRPAPAVVRLTPYCRALLWLGGRLQAWGHRLVDLGTTPRYGERLTYRPR
jgi:hypothetical protein